MLDSWCEGTTCFYTSKVRLKFEPEQQEETQAIERFYTSKVRLKFHEVFRFVEYDVRFYTSKVRLKSE